MPVSILPLISNPYPDPSGSCLPKSNASFHYMPHCICPRSLLTWHSYVIKFLHPPLQGVRRLLYRHRKPAALLSACLSVQVHSLLHSAECTGFSQALVIHSYRWVDFTLLRCLVLFLCIKTCQLPKISRHVPNASNWSVSASWQFVSKTKENNRKENIENKTF